MFWRSLINNFFFCFRYLIYTISKEAEKESGESSQSTKSKWSGVICWDLCRFRWGKITEPSKCHTNFVLDFSSLDFFLAFKFFSRFFLDFFPDFFPDYFLDFFQRWSHTPKAHSWVEVLRGMAWFDSWLCNYFIQYRWKYNTVQFDHRPFYLTTRQCWARKTCERQVGKIETFSVPKCSG